ncbi:MAG: F0F1 ATP synthase subunit B [Armatimonadetes bacterium]|nr:F0F1 ATP synthase subunit B [Armatimonadota bacterium]
MPWVIAVVLAVIFWALSQAPFIQAANEVPMLQDIGLNLSTALVQMGVVVLMFPLVNMIFLKPLREALDTRTKYLDDTYSAAESLKQRMQDLKDSYEERLARSEGEARAKIQVALKEAQQMKDSILSEARGQAEEISRRASEEMAREREKMLVDLRTHVVDLTLTATERLIGESMDQPRQRKLVEEFIKNVEVPG